MHNIKTSMYAEDTALFINPRKKVISTLANILTWFREATGLLTNFQESTVVPIRCSIADLPATRVHFLIKYLGLPLTTTRLRRVDLQFLVDKAVSKFISWNGKNTTPAGWLTLIKSVLTSQPVYLLTALQAPKEVLDEIDNKRKQFMWAGSKALTGGKCKVNWSRARRPTCSGGLGILHLGRFTTALRLRWLWHEWKSSDKPWVGVRNPLQQNWPPLVCCCNKDYHWGWQENFLLVWGLESRTKAKRYCAKPLQNF